MPEMNGFELKKSALSRHTKTINDAIRDFALYQKFPNYKWPVWLHYTPADTGKTSYSRQVTPFLCRNDTIRNVLKFTNFLSDSELLIDPTGMISVSYASWSIELWLQKGNEFFRATDSPEQVSQERNTKNSIITTTWDHPLCKVVQTIFGTRSTIDEAIVEIDCQLKSSAKDIALLFVIRPYNHQYIGEINKLEYQKDSKLLKIDGLKKIFVDIEPNYIITGNTLKGDISNNEVEELFSVSCRDGLATQALGYVLKKKDSKFYFSIALSANEMTEGEYNFDKIKQDFVDFVDLRLRKNFNIKFPEKKFQDWFFAAKISALNYQKTDLYREGFADEIDVKSFFYIIYAYNRMGYLAESGNFIDTLIKYFNYNEKKDKQISFKEIINCCYFLCAFTDYFIHTRDTDWLYSRYETLKIIANIMYRHTVNIKKLNDLKTNSIDHYLIREGHPFDLVLLSFCAGQFSYLSRCMGIFGDEIRFKKESERLADLFQKSVFDQNEMLIAEQNFFYYNAFANVPFKIPIDEEKYRKILDSIELPIHEKSVGWDIFASIIVSCNNIMYKNEKATTFMDMLTKIAGKRFTLPEFINPSSQLCSYGDGASKVVNTVLFIAIRNLLFVDYPDRLDLFPMPNASWFAPGKEIKIENAPSRFGTISFRVVSTAHEVQLFLEEVPKYIPPDIMINLPFKAKIASGDDFILKKEVNNSFVINGWPDIVKFIRK